MFVRNVLKAGMYAMPVPDGVLLMLQYSEKGNLEKVFLGLDNSEDVSSDLLPVFIKSNLCPLRVPVQGGTTWVRGVLSAKKQYAVQGSIPDCIQSSLLEDFIKDSSNFEFLCGNLESFAVKFKGAAPIRQWLGGNKFSVLDGWLVPTDTSKDVISALVEKTKTIQNKSVQGYMLYDKGEFVYASSDCSQVVVKSVSSQMDSAGCMKGHIKTCDDSVIVVDWSDVVFYNIHKDAVVRFDKNKNIVSCVYLSGKKDKWPAKITCPVCGCNYAVPESGEVICTDIHCPSTRYTTTNTFLSVFGLPEMSYDMYKQVVAGNQMFSLSDVFYLPEYADCKVKTDMFTLIRSMVDVSARVSDKAISIFASACNNNIKSALYYLSHLDALQDLQSGKADILAPMISWLSDSRNSKDVELLLQDDHIEIICGGKKFDGPPALRNKKICLTGDFVHGCNSEIEAILRSYDAQITEVLDESCSCLLVGGTSENISGHYIRICRESGIPVFEEQDFFDMYGIDEDLAENL